MREIRFRAIHKLTKHWFEDIHIIYQDGEWFEDYRALEDGRPMNLDQVSIMQYTGLKDKKDVEIYEGDIVKGWYMEKGIKNRFIGQIKFVTGCFVVDGVKPYRGQRQGLNIIFQPIGNIYENPELLSDSQ